MTLPLNESEYHLILKKYKSTKDKREANYLNIILLKHKGYGQVEISDILNLDENTISTWIKRFEVSTTLDLYLKLDYKPYSGKLSCCNAKELEDFIEKGSYSDTKPIISKVKTLFNVTYSPSGIRKLLARLGFSYKQKVALPSKLDVVKQANFVTKYETINRELKENDAIFLWMPFIPSTIPIQ